MAAELKRVRVYVAICALLCVVTLVASSIYPTGSASGGGGGGGLSAAPPYYTNGTNFFVAATGYQATLPSASPTWLNGVTPTTVTAGANGDLYFSGVGNYWATFTITSSVESVFARTSVIQTGNDVYPYTGVWVYDSTNSIIWSWGITANTANNAATTVLAVLVNWTYNGSGNPVVSATSYPYNFTATTPFQLKLAYSGGTLTPYVSLNGGTLYVPFPTQSVGTITSGGYFSNALSVGTMASDIYSFVAH